MSRLRAILARFAAEVQRLIRPEPAALGLGLLEYSVEPHRVEPYVTQKPGMEIHLDLSPAEPPGWTKLYAILRDL
jgi:hypothetical protein